MKKRIIAVLACVCLVAGLLAACSGDTSTATTAASGDTAATTAAASGDTTTAAAKAASSGDTIKIGYVNPTTGSLAGHGVGAQWCADKITSYVNDELGGIEVDGEVKNIEVIMYDSTSDQQTAADMASKLCVEDEVDIIIAINTPETAVPVETQAEINGVPCVGIQAPVNPCAEASDTHDWTCHAFWTVEDVYEVHKNLWVAAGFPEDSGAVIGLAFANDSDGVSWSAIFTERAEEDGYVIVDPGRFPSGTDDFSNVVAAYKEADIDILAGTNIPPDFSNLFTQMIAAGVEVDAITMGKCCLLPGDVEALGDNVEGIMSEVWWSVDYPYASDLTGISCSELGELYESENGGEIPQPVGYSYASLEIAVQALQEAGTLDKESIFEALKGLDIETIVGPIKYDQEMNNLTYSNTVAAGGQWQKNEDGEWKLVIIDSTVYPELEVAIKGEYKEGNATQK